MSSPLIPLVTVRLPKELVDLEVDAEYKPEVVELVVVLPEDLFDDPEDREALDEE